jgi:hypothetical protein
MEQIMPGLKPVVNDKLLFARFHSLVGLVVDVNYVQKVQIVEF